MPDDLSQIKNHKSPILVVGGGISGITAAVEAAETGYEVVLVEKLPYLGGRVIKFHEYFPKLCPPYCGLEINFKRIKNNDSISVFVSTSLDSIEGKPGDFRVKLRKQPEYINSNCTSCGKCAVVCPATRPDEYNYGMGETRAAYLPHHLAFPFQYHIDRDFCRGTDCNRCSEVCEYGAIDLGAKEQIIEFTVSSVIMATGWKPYEASKTGNLQFGKHPDIITNVMFERLTAPNGPSGGKLAKPSNGNAPESVVFVQCAGSRDKNHLPYCSAVCCSASLKHALITRKTLPTASIKLFYIDLRVTGRNEDFLKRVKEDNCIELIKGNAGKIEIINNNLFVIAEDIASGKKIKTRADLVVLATGIVPENNLPQFIETDNEGFLLSKEGISVCGCAHKPMDVSASVKDATGAA